MPLVLGIQQHHNLRQHRGDILMLEHLKFVPLCYGVINDVHGESQVVLQVEGVDS